MSLRFLCTYAAVLAALGSFAPSRVAQLFSAGVGVAVIFVALRQQHVRALGAVVILHLPFIAAETAFTADAYRTAIALGFPAIGLALVLPKIVGRIRRPASLQLFFVAYVGALLFAAAAAAIGFASGRNGWSRPLHLVLPVAGFLIGTLLAGELRFRRSMRVSVGLPLIIGAVSVLPGFSGHLVFVLAGLGGAAIGLLLTEIRSWPMLLLGIPVLAWFVSSTFTVALITLGALLLAMVMRSTPAPGKILRRVAVGGVVGTITATLYLATAAAPTTQLSPNPARDSTGQRLERKVWADRAPLLHQGGTQIAGGLPMVASGGRPILLSGWPNSNLGYQLWNNGLHNVYLEPLFQLGWAGGTLLIVAMLLAMRGAFSSGTRPDVSKRSRAKEPALIIVASATLAIFSIGAVTGQFVIEPNVGTWFWIGVGLLARSNYMGIKSESGGIPQR